MFRSTHIRLLVSDFPACFRFSRDVLGLTPRFGSEEDVYTEFQAGTSSVALFRREVMAEAIGVSGGSAAAESLGKAAVVFKTENVDITADTLRAKGVAIVAEPTNRPDWGCRTAHFRDPDGNLIEVYSSLPA